MRKPWPLRKRSPTTKSSPTTDHTLYDYEMSKVFEAGMMLTGPEVKSLRTGKATVAGELHRILNKQQASWITLQRQHPGEKSASQPLRPQAAVGRVSKCARQERNRPELAKGVEGREGMTIVPCASTSNDEGHAEDRHRAGAPARSCTASARIREGARLEPRTSAADAARRGGRGEATTSRPGHVKFCQASSSLQATSVKGDSRHGFCNF